MAFNDDDFKHYPNYIERDCATNRQSYSAKLSKSICKELDELFDAKYGHGQRQQGLHDMVMEYLNTKCLQRKSYNFEYHILLRKNHDIDKSDMLPVGFIDYYNLTRDLHHELNMQDNFYLKQPDELQPVHISKYKDNLFEFLTRERFSHGMLESKYFKSEIAENPEILMKQIDEWKISNNIDDIYELSFNLNNYLDYKLKGQYVGQPFGDEIIHKGIGEFIDAENQSYFFTYEWSHISVGQIANHIVLIKFELLDYGDFMELCKKSDNPLLHKYVGANTLARKLADDNVTIDAEIQHAKDKIRKWQETLQELEIRKSNQLNDD